ncbi:hypothetical protein SESBI_24054 [Sesbania bispinosa]|nr:hypothetical protein SESBI_24054 [Sesbania bispinosa]
MKDEKPASDAGELKTTENAEREDKIETLKENQSLSRADEASKKRKRVKNAKFVGSSPEIRSLWDSRFEFGNLINAECSLPGYQSQLDKWGPHYAHVMLQIQGRVALLNQEKQDLAQKNRTLSDELSQMKTDKEVAEAALLQEKVDHEATKTKSAADRYQLTAEATDS